MSDEHKETWRKLITEDDWDRLFENGRRRNKRLADGKEPEDEVPLVLLFTPDAGCRWLLSHINPVDYDLAYGVCDMGMGWPELDYVSFSELVCLRGELGLPVQRHPYFGPDKTNSRYLEEARAKKRLVIDTQKFP